jgi:hypothetical protein
MMKTSSLLLLLMTPQLLLLVGLSYAQSQNECSACADSEEDPSAFDDPRGAEDGPTCKDLVENAARLTDGSQECQENQLATFQLGCCVSPPQQFCSLCRDGRPGFDSTRTIPRDVSESVEFTCENVAILDRFVQEYIGTAGECQTTLLARSAYWCGCPEAVQEAAPCQLLCNNGNSPTDLNLSDPVTGKTCARFQYEYSLLTSNECARASTYIGFDATSFCCTDVEPEDNCPICPFGQKLMDPNTVVTTEFFGEVTCGDIAEYAR